MKSTIKFILFNLFLTTTIIAQNEEFGIASYYSDLFHGKPTASGELYNKAKMTAAHKTLPFGTLVKVTDLKNNKSVQVRVNDRGPFISGRVIELSREAASRIGLVDKGVSRVKIQVIQNKATAPVVADAGGSDKEETPKSFENADKKIEPKKAETTTPTPAPAKKATAAVADNKGDKGALKVNKKPAQAAKVVAAEVVPAQSASKSVLVKGEEYEPVGLYEIELKKPEAKGFGVQVAALTNQNALFKKIAELQGDWFSNILVNVEKGSGDNMTYKIILGSFPTQGEAKVYKDNLKKKKKIKGFVVDLSSFAGEEKK